MEERVKFIDIMNKKIRLKYPKFLLLFTTFLAAYLIFYGRIFQPLHDFVVSMGYAGVFIAGILFAYGFTAAPATAMLLILAGHHNIYLAGIIGGLGALIGDLFIFNFIRHSFADEISKFRKEKIVLYLSNKMPNLFKKYLVPVFAGFIIASPLPDEVGVALLAASGTISTKIFSLLSYALNTAGIFAILTIGKLV